MKKFEFPLARAARWWRQILTAEQTALAAALAELAELDRQVQALQQRRNTERDLMHTNGTFTGHDLQALAAYAARIRQDIARLQGMRGRLTARVEEQRARVVAADRRVRMVQNLEDRRRAEWLREVDKEVNDVAMDAMMAKLAREAREFEDAGPLGLTEA